MDSATPRHDLYPKIEPRASGRLRLDNLHEMYWEEAGNPDGLPVVFLHGGPGAGINPSHRRFFDPDRFRIILFDQRGAGRSTPYAEVRQNSTPLLIDDIERLREHLSVERWLVFGGSWGATLALAYGIAHPERCLGFVLRGVFLGRPMELDWFLNGMQTVFPETWRNFRDFLPEAERSDILENYRRRLMEADPRIHLPAAEAWNRYETDCSTLRGPSNSYSGTGGSAALALARIEIHYFVNNIFMSDNHILENVGRLVHLPAVIVQGRYDMVCPVTTADSLAQAWPAAELNVVPDAGHSAMEPGIRSALVAATDSYKLSL